MERSMGPQSSKIRTETGPTRAKCHPEIVKGMTDSFQDESQNCGDDGSSFRLSQKVVDASVHPICWILSCPLIHFGFCPYQTVLTFGTYELVREDVAICGTRTIETPYAELGEVEVSHFFCLTCVDSGIGTLLPGMGCDRGRARIIADQLELGMRTRGDTKQVQLAESILHRTNSINKKLELIETVLSQRTCRGSVELQSMTEREDDIFDQSPAKDDKGKF